MRPRRRAAPESAPAVEKRRRPHCRGRLLYPWLRLRSLSRCRRPRSHLRRSRPLRAATPTSRCAAARPSPPPRAASPFAWWQPSTAAARRRRTAPADTPVASAPSRPVALWRTSPSHLSHLSHLHLSHPARPSHRDAPSASVVAGSRAVQRWSGARCRVSPSGLSSSRCRSGAMAPPIVRAAADAVRTAHRACRTSRSELTRRAMASVVRAVSRRRT